MPLDDTRSAQRDLCPDTYPFNSDGESMGDTCIFKKD